MAIFRLLIKLMRKFSGYVFLEHSTILKNPTIMVVRNNAGNPDIVRSISSCSVIQSIAMLIKNENIPNVKIITGNDKIFKIGFKTIFAAASIAPAMIKETRFPVKFTLLII